MSAAPHSPESMPRCATCHHWGPNVVNVDRRLVALTGACRSPMLGSEVMRIDVDSRTAAIDGGDGSEVLVTGREFGCVNHEPRITVDLEEPTAEDLAEVGRLLQTLVRPLPAKPTAGGPPRPMIMSSPPPPEMVPPPAVRVVSGQSRVHWGVPHTVPVGTYMIIDDPEMPLEKP